MSDEMVTVSREDLRMAVVIMAQLKGYQDAGSLRERMYYRRRRSDRDAWWRADVSQTFGRLLHAAWQEEN